MLTEAEVRRRRITGGIAALIGVLLIVLAVLAITGKLGATDASTGASKEAVSAGATTVSGSASAGSSAPAADVKAPLTVLNASSTAGLAAKGKAAFEAEGWEVPTTANLAKNAPSQSTVYYPANDKEAKSAAEALVASFPKLTAAEAPSGLGYDGVVVVLTGDWVPGQ